MAVVGVIPAAGYATRLQPIPVSKEIYPIDGKPVMDHLVERMLAVPDVELRVVTRPEKLDVVENAKRHGATVIEARPASLAESLLTGLEGLNGDDTVLFGFPDSIWEPADGFLQVLPLLDSGWEVALGLFRAADLSRYEPVLFEPSGRVTRIEFKPEQPSSSWIWGCGAAPARMLWPLEREQEPGRYFDSLCDRGLVGGACLGEYLDMGTADGLREALDSEPAGP